MKKQIIISTIILFILISISGVLSLEFSEDEQGDSFYEAEAEMKVPSMSIRDLFILQPSLEPANPETGMIYFDVNDKRLKLYDGTGWYSIALEKVSKVSKKQVKETVEEEHEPETCEESIDCGGWGDCINNYQTMNCVTVETNCNKHEDSETRDCVSDFKLESAAKESHDVVEETTGEVEETETTEEEIEEEEEEAEEESEPAEEVPEELFDITFDLEENSLSSSDKLVIWITLQNFGKRYVPARLVYSITDEEGIEVYRKFEEVRVYTDESIITQFDDLTLKKGDYTLSMRVEYAGIVEEFSDDFSVETGVINAIKRFFMRLF